MMKEKYTIKQDGFVGYWHPADGHKGKDFHSCEGLPHGFGLGTGTVAEDWINDAVAFWEEQVKQVN